MQSNSPDAVNAAIAHLATVGLTLEPASKRWQARGFDFYCPQAQQMLSRSDVVVFAANERDLREGQS